MTWRLQIEQPTNLEEVGLIALIDVRTYRSSDYVVTRDKLGLNRRILNKKRLWKQL
jgi:hypothetical protein